MTAGIKKVCNKRVNESSQLIVDSDDSFAESPEFSVESVSTDVMGEDQMVPITPRSKCEGVDYLLVLEDSTKQELIDCDSQCEGGGFVESGCDSPPSFSSPVRESVKSDSLTNDGGFSSEDSPCTPKKDVFDPFAPGPEKLNWAPYCRKFAKELKVLPVVRKLQFDMCSEFDQNSEDLIISEEEMIIQSIYLSILEVIISSQSSENLTDGCRTPTDEPRLTGIADTCPGAPIKGSNRFKRFDNEMCRKIEF